MNPNRPVSEAYKPQDPSHTVTDETALPENWGYSLGYEVGAEGQNVPEGGNTVAFRLPPGGMLEPFFVTKPEAEATFTVTVMTGSARFLCARADGELEDRLLATGETVQVHPGDTYTYKNTAADVDLVLSDVARPAFNEGDEVELTASLLPSDEPLSVKDNYSACIVKTVDGSKRTIEVPTAFYDRMAELMR